MAIGVLSRSDHFSGCGRVVPLLGDVERHGALVRGGDPEADGGLPGLHRGGRPVGAGPVQRPVLVAVGGAQVAVGDDRPALAVGVGDVDLVPVVQRLGAAVGDEVLADLGPGVLRAFRVAGGDPADGGAERAVRAGRAGGEARRSTRAGGADRAQAAAALRRSDMGGLLVVRAVMRCGRREGGTPSIEIGLDQAKGPDGTAGSADSRAPVGCPPVRRRAGWRWWPAAREGRASSRTGRP